MMLVFKRLNRRSAALLLWLVISCCWCGSSYADDESDAEAAYRSAIQSANSGQFKQALQALRKLQHQYPSYSNIVAVKTRIAVLHEADFAGTELITFLNALDARDAGDVDTALQLLRELVTENPSSPLVDDAIYLMAYVHLMERFDYDTVRAHLTELRQRVPETPYRDAAAYLTAISFEQSGQTEQAVALFRSLRDRHTSVSLPFGYRIARGNVMSRYWFDRADRRLKILAEQRSRSSTLSARNQVTDDVLQLSVLVGGVEVDLMLQPSALTQTTQWRDAFLRDQTPPAMGVFAGHVSGHTDSWARVVVSENDIHGLIMIDGVESRLHSEDLIGTLDYYQPKHRAGTQIKMGGSESELPLLLDTLPTPPMQPVDMLRSGKRLGSSKTDMRVVPMSLVIDSQYNRYYNGNALLHAISGLNVADAIYKPLGLALQLDESIVFDELGPDPMALGPTTLETMLRNFRDYRQEKSTLFSDSALVYLFTGNPKTDITLGLAWIDTACRTDGFDVGVTTPSSFSDVLLTHELGHSLGARHDTDTECSGTKGKLMSPRISGNTDTSMTTCSQQSIGNSLNRACFLDALDLSLNVWQTGNTVAIDIKNLDSQAVATAQLVIEVDRNASVTWPVECEAIGPASAECQIDGIKPQSTTTVSLPYASSGEPRLSVQVTARDAVDPNLSNNAVSLNSENLQTQPSVIVASNEINSVAFSDSDGSDTPQLSAAKSGAVSWIWLAGMAVVLIGVSADRRNERTLSAQTKI